MNKKGATILEVLIYFSLFTMLVVVLFPWVFQAQARFMQCSKNLQTTIDQHCAYDVLVHDIRQASSNKQQWKLITDTSLIWHDAEYDIGWSLHKNSLVRTQGTYNPTLQKWSKKRGSIVMRTVKDINFDIGYNTKDIQKIICTLTLTNDKQMQQVMYLNNRELV